MFGKCRSAYGRRSIAGVIPVALQISPSITLSRAAPGHGSVVLPPSLLSKPLHTPGQTTAGPRPQTSASAPPSTLQGTASTLTRSLSRYACMPQGELRRETWFSGLVPIQWRTGSPMPFPTFPKPSLSFWLSLLPSHRQSSAQMYSSRPNSVLMQSALANPTHARSLHTRRNPSSPRH